APHASKGPQTPWQNPISHVKKRPLPRLGTWPLTQSCGALRFYGGHCVNLSTHPTKQSIFFRYANLPIGVN
ncbi:MAG: hypothetical protein ACOYNP_13735, partial [Gemmataceae bacterium]